jgi:hypothetical protein
LPRYDYYCPECDPLEPHKLAELNVPISEMDDQYCDCGAKLVRVFTPTMNIAIPMAFATTGDPCLPDNDEERKRWDDCGVSSRKGGRWV